ncbi:MAG: flagellar motor protein MotB, partial [Cytophagaceae bacterium]
MNWTKYIAIAGYLSLTTLPSSTIWAQSPKQATPTKNVALVEGIFWDADTKKPIANVSISAKTQDGVVRAQQSSNAEGSYQIKLDPRQSYVMTAKANGYAPLDEQITFTSPTV